MSKRQRQRKAKRLAEQKVVRQEVRERFKTDWTWLKKWGKWGGITIGGLAVIAGLVFGISWGVKNINMDSFSKTVKGPFGEITKTELANNKFATLETTDGNIKIELDTKQTPNAAANFVLLAKKNFYDGVRFHRIIKGFMIQAGDPNSRDEDFSNDGTGGPGYKFNDEKFTGEYKRGTVAMANSGANTNGSQFFIVHQDSTSLPKNYVIFGHVVEGLDAVDKIAETPVVDNGTGEMSRPKEQVTINKIILSEK